MTARPARRVSPPRAPRAGHQARVGAGLDALADLREDLRLAKASDPVRKHAPIQPDSQHRPPTPTGSEPHRDATSARDEEALFRTAVRDVAPLKKNNRAELGVPKPSPVPRQRPNHADEGDAPDDARGARAPEEDAQLFRSSMRDVTPLRHAAYYAAATTTASKPTVGIRPGHERDMTRLIDEFARLLPADADEMSADALFRIATQGARPLIESNRVMLAPDPPRPEPIKRCEDEQAALRETMDAPLTLEDRLEMGDEAAFLRPGLPRRILTDLRRGRWVLQGELDLHGLNRDEARSALAEFLRNCLQRGQRCVRIIHGKGLGSPGKESILKRLSRGWLAQREEILAFCQANPNQGGSGALMVLLRGQSASKSE